MGVSATAEGSKKAVNSFPLAHCKNKDKLVQQHEVVKDVDIHRV